MVIEVEPQMGKRGASDGDLRAEFLKCHIGSFLQPFILEEIWVAVGVMLDAQGSRRHHDDIACGFRPMYPERSPSKTQYAEGPFKHATVFGVFLKSGLSFS